MLTVASFDEMFRPPDGSDIAVLFAWRQARWAFIRHAAMGMWGIAQAAIESWADAESRRETIDIFRDTIASGVWAGRLLAIQRYTEN